MALNIVKRDGRAVNFETDKIADAIEKAFVGTGVLKDREVADKLAQQVVRKIEKGAIEGTPTVEGVQDLVEEVLAENGFVQVARSYIK
jgi:ribonucleoside-triphosphate reductase